MDSIILATDSLNALGGVMSVALSMLAVVASVAAGTVVAMKLAPFSPSDEVGTPVTVSKDARYVMTQLRLMEVRAARKAQLDSDAASTRRVSTDLATVRTMPTGSVAVGFTLSVG